MSLQSLEKVLGGVGKLRAASVLAAAISAATFLGLHLSAGVQEAGLTGATVLIAVVNIVDGYIRGQHVSALPSLIAQGAESVVNSHDPRVDSLAQTVETLAARAAALENRPTSPSLPEIIAGLTGKNDASVVLPAAPVVSPVDPLAPASAA